MTRARRAFRRRARRMARFPRLREIRAERLGWEIFDIAARLPERRPSLSSIYRLEIGLAIRVASARRVFDVVNAALGHTLDAGKELEIE
jgi:hypothetical protein